jgi:hypothetical protein
VNWSRAAFCGEEAFLRLVGCFWSSHRFRSFQTDSVSIRFRFTSIEFSKYVDSLKLTVILFCALTNRPIDVVSTSRAEAILVSK